MNSADEIRPKHKVYIVDDHPVIYKGLSYLINRESDLTVCGTAEDFQSALKGIDSCSPDIVTVDITLGDISGIHLLEKLALRHPDLPCVVLSMHDESVYAERCLRAGARGYIMKTEHSDKIIASLRTVLAGGIFISENLQRSFLSKFVSGRDGGPRPPLSRLSNRELEVFRLIARGLKAQQIANRLNLSVKTIESHIDHIKQKENFKSSHDMFVFAVRWAMNESVP